MKQGVKKLLYFLSVIFVLIPVFFVGCNVKENDLQYKQHHIGSISYKIVRPDNIDKPVIKSEIDVLLNHPKYVLIHTDLASPLNGLADMKEDKIYIESSLSLEDYCFTLTHEIVHIKYNENDERRTNVIAWKTLFFSGNDYFKNIALRFANYDLRGYVDYDYSILGYVEKYIMEDQQCL